MSRPALRIIHIRSRWFKEGKNCNMSKANVLVEVFLVQPKQMICIRVTLASMVDLNFSLSN